MGKWLKAGHRRNYGYTNKAHRSSGQQNEDDQADQGYQCSSQGRKMSRII